MKNFKIGDIVSLSNSKIKMTVRSFNRIRVTCNWFEGKELKEQTFDNEELVIR